MKDVISVDSIVSYVADSSITLGNRHPRVLKEAKQRLHSLLISKLPEKLEYGDNNGKTAMPSEVVGYNSAIDDMKAIYDEMFGVEK